jgi:hypothetical protein
MRKAEISAAVRDLDYLSLLEYRERIEDLTQTGETNDKILRLGRLIGVMLKEPFAVPTDLKARSPGTGAYRKWNFDKASVRSASKRRTWQFQVIAKLTDEHSVRFDTVADFMTHAHDERGFFRYFAESLQKYLCGDPKLRKKVESALKASLKGGTPLPTDTPEKIMAIGGAALGVWLVKTIPLLGFVGVPVIAALVVIIYSVGIDAFCKWISDSQNTSSNER